MKVDMRRDIVDHCQRLPVSFYDTHQTGDVLSRLTHDTFNISELYHHGPEDRILSVVKCVGAVALVVWGLHRDLAIMLVGCLVIMGVYEYLCSQRMQQALRRSRDIMGDLSAQIDHSLAGIRTIKALTAERQEQQHFNVSMRSFSPHDVRYMLAKPGFIRVLKPCPTS